MRRTTKLDAPGVTHRVMIRGIERRNIFRNNKDREDFLERLEKLHPVTRTACYNEVFLSIKLIFYLEQVAYRYPT